MTNKDSQFTTSNSQQNLKPFPLETRFAFRKHMIINREFEPLLRNSGLDNFDSLMKFENGEVVKRKISERSTVRFHVPDEGRQTLVYLKRYRYSRISNFLKNCLTFSRTYSAIHEWRKILEFKASNLPTMTPIAVGVRSLLPFLSESFLLTQGIPQTTTLEKLLGDNFAPPLDKTRWEQKRSLVYKLASLTRKMHEEGFRHQDFYLCHILINWSNPDAPLLYIADLHRVIKVKRRAKRWKIKDLAALNYSAPEKIISRANRLRFLKHYDPRLAGDRLFIKAIIKKTERIRNHTEKKGSVRD